MQDDKLRFEDEQKARQKKQEVLGTSELHDMHSTQGPSIFSKPSSLHFHLSPSLSLVAFFRSYIYYHIIHVDIVFVAYNFFRVVFILILTIRNKTKD